MSRFKKLWGQKKHALRVRLGLSQEEEDELNEVPDDAAEHFLKFGQWPGEDPPPASLVKVRNGGAASSSSAASQWGYAGASSSSTAPSPATVPSASTTVSQEEAVHAGPIELSMSVDMDHGPVELKFSSSLEGAAGRAAGESPPPNACFICGTPLEGLDNARINEHVDACLMKAQDDAPPLQVLSEDPFSIQCPYNPSCPRMEACAFPEHVLEFHTRGTSQRHACPICDLMSDQPSVAHPNLMFHIQAEHGDMHAVINNSWDRGLRFSVPAEIGDGMIEVILKESIEKECVICFEEFSTGETVRTLECFCMFHKDCIQAWFEKKEKVSCPVHAEDDE